MKTITDLTFSAYLKLKGYKLVDYNTLGKGRCSYTFEITDEDYKTMRLEYINSEISKVKQITEELKDMCY